LEARAAGYYGAARERTRDLVLPLVHGVNDYKAANLVYTEARGPVLVDPDNGSYLPRLWDLAIVALIFHTDPDLQAGPHACLTHDEWRIVLDAYQAHVRLTAHERSVWPDVLLACWMDEALWLLALGARRRLDVAQETLC
jgi:spectinomycin phosphotransferase